MKYVPVSDGCVAVSNSANVSINVNAIAIAIANASVVTNASVIANTSANANANAVQMCRLLSGLQSSLPETKRSLPSWDPSLAFGDSRHKPLGIRSGTASG
jgi:hypothetical protein